MTRAARIPSIRAQFLAVLLLGAILPLTLIGFLLTRAQVRYGERLLEEHLDSSLVALQRAVDERWEYRQGHLLLLAENANARQVIATGRITSADSLYFTELAAALAGDVVAFTYRGPDDAVLYTRQPVEAELRGTETNGAAAEARPPVFTVRQPVPAPDGPAGSVEVDFLLEAVLPGDAARLLLPGALLAARHRASGQVLVPLPGELAYPTEETLALDDTPWRVRTASMASPPLELAVVGAEARYVTFFQRTARTGLLAVLLVAALALVLTAFVTARITHPVRALAGAADDVANGRLTGAVRPGGPAEVRALGAAFNLMTEKLRRLMQEVAEQRALAAVGEFATSLSHEVRNALSSVQIDLQRLKARSQSTVDRELLARTLAHVRRLDAAVTGALRVARSGAVPEQEVVLADVLAEAVRLAKSEEVDLGPAGPRGDGHAVVRGDPDALRQLFLNLLLNARQWSARPEEVRVDVGTEGDQAVVAIHDTGAGMSDEQVRRAFDPYYSTRPGGTGLGLPIARQITLAHGGDLSIRSRPGSGTTVEVRLPVLSCPSMVVHGETE